MTVLADHGAPVGVAMPRAFNSAAIALADLPASSARTGAMACARAVASACRAAELHSARPGRAQPRLGAFRDHPALLLRHRSIDIDHESIDARHIARHEIDLALHQTANEMNIAREPIELDNDELRPVLLTGSNCFRQFGSIRAFAAQ